MTTHSAVVRREATPAASTSAVRTTFVGSIIPRKKGIELLAGITNYLLIPNMCVT